MIVEKNVHLQEMNAFGIVAKAHVLMRVKSLDDLHAVAEKNLLGGKTPFILGGGSNVVITGDIKAPVVRIEIPGIALVNETAKAWLVEAGAGVNWHDLVAWTLESGYPGLENLALIPGSVGASPVQNIGAYGVELQDRFDSLQAFDLVTGRSFELRAEQCAFGYRDSVFKHTAAKEGDFGLAGRAIVTSVRFLLPKNWKPEVDYADLSRKCQQTGIAKPTPRQVFDWVVAIRRAKLPDPAVIGNAGSFFKNPVVSAEQCADIIQREPTIVHYRLHDGTVKLAAGWLIDACGWRGKTLGNAGVYDKQALILVNYGAAHHRQAATGGEVMTLAKAIQTSVYERFGLKLEPEPVVV